MSSHRLAKFFLSLPFRLTTVTSRGRRTAPYRLSGSRAAAPLASTASTERSIGTVSFAAGDLGLGAAFAAGPFAPGAFWVVPPAASGGGGPTSVGARENSSAVPPPRKAAG